MMNHSKKYKVIFTDPKTGKTYESPLLNTFDEACDYAHNAEAIYKTPISLIREYDED